jgi:hypothetical protein
MRLGTYFGHRPKIAGQTGNCQSKKESCVIVNKLFMLSSSGAKTEIETMVSIHEVTA